jgi:hypothetical protein
MAIINKTGITNGGTIQAEHITRVIDALSGVSTDTLILSGSMTGSLIGTLTGTASFATSASRAVSSSFAISSSRAVSSSFAATASYALNVGTSGEYMTLRLTAEKTNTTSTVFWVGANGSGDAVDRTGVLLPFDCTIVSASIYSNVQSPAAAATFISPSLYYNTTISPTVSVAFDPIDLKTNYISGQHLPVNLAASADKWINLEISESDTDTCNYTITCDVLIKKT